MNKRKIMLVASVLMMVAILGFGGTLAYLTDEDNADNIFTVGNVAIELTETFTQESKLMPGAKNQNNVTKEVFVTNTGSEDAYVRVHLAIPTILDDGDPDFDAMKNILHFNNSNMGDGKWNWSTSVDGNDDSGEDYLSATGKWNFYTTTIDEIPYNVYIVTYETALKAGYTAEDGTEVAGETTPAAMDQVYMDGKVTSELLERLIEGDDEHVGLGTEWHFYVAAEAVQAAGFETAFDAFAGAKDDLPADPFNK